MSEIISAVANQIQQSLQEQTLKQPPQQSAEKRSFESYLQQQTPDAPNGGAAATGGAEKSTVQTAPPVSGAEMQNKLEQMQTELAERFKQNTVEQNKVNALLPELLDNKSRLGLLKEAYVKMGGAAKPATDFGGQLIKLEGEFKGVESIMKSDKNLSPGELLALQARLYQVSQHIEVMSKVVDQMAGGIKTILNTNI